MTSRALVAVLCVTACGIPPVDTEAPEGPAPKPAQPGPERVTLTLETRQGESRLGYSFAERKLVEGVGIRLSAWDCGARGRWVDLIGYGAQFCAHTSPDCEWWDSVLPAGGSGGAFEGEVWVKQGEALIGKMKVVKYTPTPFEWYEQQPTPPFEVTLEVVR